MIACHNQIGKLNVEHAALEPGRRLIPDRAASVLLAAAKQEFIAKSYRLAFAR